MEFIKKNLKSILIVIVIFGGLIVSLVLIQNPTIFKSKAAENIDYPGALNITDSSGQELTYKGEGVYIIKGDKIKIGVKNFSHLVITDKQLSTEILKVRLFNAAGETSRFVSCLQTPNTSECEAAYNSYEGEKLKLSNIPPLSEIPASCKTIGPSPFLKIPEVDPILKRLPRLPENRTFDRRGRPAGSANSWLNPDPAEIAASLGDLLALFGSTYQLPYIWDDTANIPKTEGEEDPRWVLRTLRMLATLEHPLTDKDRSGNWTNNRSSSWITNKALDVWYKRNGESLDTACQRVLELKEQLLLQGIWLPSDDKLETIGRDILGQ